MKHREKILTRRLPQPNEIKVVRSNYSRTRLMIFQRLTNPKNAQNLQERDADEQFILG